MTTYSNMFCWCFILELARTAAITPGLGSLAYDGNDWLLCWSHWVSDASTNWCHIKVRTDFLHNYSFLKFVSMLAFLLLNKLPVFISTVAVRGDSHIKVTGMLVRKLKLYPSGRQMWVWLKLILTAKMRTMLKQTSK